MQPRTRCSWEITDFFCANRFSRGEYYTHLRASPGPRNSFADALFTQGLMALMQPIICCVRAQSAREFVTDFSGGARRTEAVWPGSELRGVPR